MMNNLITSIIAAAVSYLAYFLWKWATHIHTDKKQGNVKSPKELCKVEASIWTVFKYFLIANVIGATIMLLLLKFCQHEGPVVVPESEKNATYNVEG